MNDKSIGVSDKIEKVLSVIDDLSEGQCLIVPFRDRDADKVRGYVRKLLTRQGIGDNIVMSVNGNKDSMYVLRKSKSYVQKLEELMREMLLHVDDENLYDRALSLLEKNG